MDGRELLKQLMARAGDNPNALASRLASPKLQTALQRFLDGTIKNPRWQTLEPVAAHYGVPVQAFFTEVDALAAAAAVGLVQSGDSMPSYGGSRVARAPTPIRSNAPPRVSDLVTQLGALLAREELMVRKAAAVFLESLALTPENADVIAHKMSALMTSQAIDPQPASTASPQQ